MTTFLGGQRKGLGYWGGTPPVQPVAEANYEISGVKNMPANGAIHANVGWEGAFASPFTYEPKFMYFGKDADASGWTPFAGSNAPYLTKVSDGGGLTFDNETPFGAGQSADDYAVEASKGDYYRATNVGCELSTDKDLLFCMALRADGGNPAETFVCLKDSVLGYGWEVGYGINGGLNACNMQLVGAGGNVQQSAYAALGEYGWWHMPIWYVDRSQSDGFRGNGWGLLEGGNANPTGVGDMDDPVADLTVFADEAGANKADGALYWFGYWELPAGTINPDFSYTYANKLAQAVFQTVCGVQSQRAPAYNTCNPSRTGYKRVWTGVGNQILTSYGQVATEIDGEPGWWLCDGTRWNYCPRSAGQITSWSLADAGDARPDGSSLTADATDGPHGVYIDCVSLGAGSWMAASVTFDPAEMTQQWVRCDAEGNGAYFDVNNKVVGTALGTIGNSGVFEHEDGMVTCWWQFTSAGNDTISVYGANGDNDLNFAGNASDVSLYMYWAQVEVQQVSEPIYTTTGAASRNEDQVDLDASDNNGFDGTPCGSFTMQIDVKMFGYPSADKSLMNMSNSYSSTNNIELRVKASTGYASCWCETSTGSLEDEAIDGDGVDICDGEWHTIEWGWDATNKLLKIRVDGGAITTASGITTQVNAQNWFVLNGDYDRANGASCIFRRRKVFAQDML